MNVTSRRKAITLFLILNACARFFFASSAAAQESRGFLYDSRSGQVTVLGTLGGAQSEAYGINAAGQVVGWANTNSVSYSDPHAFVTGPNGEGMRDLGTLNSGPLTFSRAYGINAAGQVVGASGFRGSHGSSAPFITGPDGQGMRNLGTLAGHHNSAAAINNVGQVVGSYVIYSEYSAVIEARGFITGPNGEGITVLGTLGGNISSAYGINDAGQVVGDSYNRSGDYHAFITGPNGQGMTDLGTLGGTASMAGDINDAGQVAGSSRTSSGAWHAFITGPNGQGMTDLGTLGGSESFAMGINDSSQVVGWSGTSSGAWHAFITGPNGQGMTDLGRLLADGENQALGINDVGQVVGVLTIPEPGSYAFMLVGLSLIAFAVRRVPSLREGDVASRVASL